MGLDDGSNCQKFIGPFGHLRPASRYDRWRDCATVTGTDCDLWPVRHQGGEYLVRSKGSGCRMGISFNFPEEARSGGDVVRSLRLLIGSSTRRQTDEETTRDTSINLRRYVQSYEGTSVIEGQSTKSEVCHAIVYVSSKYCVSITWHSRESHVMFPLSCRVARARQPFCIFFYFNYLLYCTEYEVVQGGGCVREMKFLLMFRVSPFLGLSPIRSPDTVSSLLPLPRHA